MPFSLTAGPTFRLAAAMIRAMGFRPWLWAAGMAAAAGCAVGGSFWLAGPGRPMPIFGVPALACTVAAWVGVSIGGNLVGGLLKKLFGEPGVPLAIAGDDGLPGRAIVLAGWFVSAVLLAVHLPIIMFATVAAGASWERTGFLMLLVTMLTFIAIPITAVNGLRVRWAAVWGIVAVAICGLAAWISTMPITWPAFGGGDFPIRFLSAVATGLGNAQRSVFNTVSGYGAFFFSSNAVDWAELPRTLMAHGVILLGTAAVALGRPIRLDRIERGTTSLEGLLTAMRSKLSENDGTSRPSVRWRSHSTVRERVAAESGMSVSGFLWDVGFAGAGGLAGLAILKMGVLAFCAFATLITMLRVLYLLVQWAKAFYMDIDPDYFGHLALAGYDGRRFLRETVGVGVRRFSWPVLLGTAAVATIIVRGNGPVAAAGLFVVIPAFMVAYTMLVRVAFGDTLKGGSIMIGGLILFPAGMVATPFLYRRVVRMLDEGERPAFHKNLTPG